MLSTLSNMGDRRACTLGCPLVRGVDGTANQLLEPPALLATQVSKQVSV